MSELPRISAPDDFEVAVFVRTALSKLPEAPLPDTFEQDVLTKVYPPQPVPQGAPTSGSSPWTRAILWSAVAIVGIGVTVSGIAWNMNLFGSDQETPTEVAPPARITAPVLPPDAFTPDTIAASSTAKPAPASKTVAKKKKRRSTGPKVVTGY